MGDTTAYCSTNCIRYDRDSSIDNSKIREKREELLSHPKSKLRSLARSVGAKISYRPPGEGSRDIPKEGVILRIIQKIFVSQEPPVQALVQYPEASLQLEEEGVENSQEEANSKKRKLPEGREQVPVEKFQLEHTRYVRETVVEIRRGYETQFSMLQTLFANVLAVGQNEEASNILKKQKKLIKKHKLQQRILSSMVVIRDTIVPDDSSDESESSDNTFGDLDINSLVAN